MQKKPFQIQRHLACKLNLPTGVSYSMTGEMLGVANRLGQYSITFYRINNHRCASAPFNVISAKELLAHDLATAHDITFSPDNQTVAVTCKPVCHDSPGQTGLIIYDYRGKRFTPVFIRHFGNECLHSISYHPSGKYLSVTHAEQDVWILERQASGDWNKILSIPIDKRGKKEGAKGVAFSPTGDCLAISTMAPMILIYAIDI